MVNIQQISANSHLDRPTNPIEPQHPEEQPAHTDITLFYVNAPGQPEPAISLHRGKRQLMHGEAEVKPICERN